MAKIHPAIAEHAMEENERLRGLLREVSESVRYQMGMQNLNHESGRRHYEKFEGRLQRIDAALSQQAEPDHVEDMRAMVVPAPAQDEPVYQLQRLGTPAGWRDADREAYDSAAKMDGYLRRTLYRRPAQTEQSRWISVEDRLPPVRQILSDSCVLEGKEIPALYRSADVICWDGKRVCCQIVEWFHAKMPIGGVTHWMPLPAAPAQGGQ